MSQKRTRNFVLLTLILPALMVSLLNAPRQAFADDTLTDQPKLWSLEEVKTIYEDFKTQLTTTCGSDTACRRNFLNELKAQDSKYGAITSFANSAFMVTSINPTKNKLKVYYRDFDYRTWERRGEEVYRDLTELYICWLDPDFEVWQFSANLRQGNEMPGLHPITRISASINNGERLPFPANEEVEISVPEAANLINNTKQNLYFSAWTGFGSNYTSNSDYSACLDSSNYELGAECKIMFKEDGGITYLPFKAQETLATFEPTSEGYGQAEENADVKTTTPVKEAINQSSPNIPTPPNTGTETSEPDNAREIIIPWWFIILLVICNAILIHFFGPKSKKTIDKNKRMR